MAKALLRVVVNEPVAEQVYRMTLEGELVSSMTEPGQFVHIRCGNGLDPLLRRPISICDVNLDEQKLTIIYRAEGKGTKLLAASVPNQYIDLLGPLGRGFPIENRKDGERVLLVGGGVGVPPLYYLSKELHKRGLEVVHILGFQSAAQVFLADEFAQLGGTYVTTIDGSMGRQGLVTDLVDEWPIESWDALYACGPTPMLRALSQRFNGKTEAYLSLEERMGCGVGACLACVCHTPDSTTDYKKICTDGPVFSVGEVII